MYPPAHPTAHPSAKHHATRPRQLPAPVGAVLSRLPAYPGSVLLVTALNLALARHLPADVLACVDSCGRCADPVQVNLYTDASRRTWIKWKSQRTAILSCIREPYSTGWVDHEIALDGKQYRLRILVKPIGDGYMISNHGRGFEMVVLRHTYCS
eukprot:gene35495-43762_t